MTFDEEIRFEIVVLKINFQKKCLQFHLESALRWQSIASSSNTWARTGACTKKTIQTEWGSISFAHGTRRLARASNVAIIWYPVITRKSVWAKLTGANSIIAIIWPTRFAVVSKSQKLVHDVKTRRLLTITTFWPDNFVTFFSEIFNTFGSCAQIIPMHQI